MIDFQNNRSLIIKLSILIVSVIILLGIILYCRANTIELSASFSHVMGLKKNDQVLIENVPIGKVNEISFDEINEGKLIVSLAVNSDVNIPDKSIAEIITLNKKLKNMAINIKLVASIAYLEEGDTILTSPDASLIDSLINISQSTSQIIRDSIKITGKTYKSSNIYPIFKVQILVSKNKLAENATSFKGLPDIEFYFDNDLYKYAAGNFKTVDKAKLYCEQLKKTGFKDAFVIALLEGKRTSIADAVELLKK